MNNHQKFMKQLLKISRKSQLEIAAILEVTPGLISHIITGRRRISPEMIIKLHENFGYSIPEIKELIN